jgi:hypothetical protein
MDYWVLNHGAVVEDDELIRCQDMGDDEWDQLVDEYSLEVEEEDNYEDTISWTVLLDNRPNTPLRMFYEVVGVPPDIIDKLWWRVEDWWMEHKHELLKHNLGLPVATVLHAGIWDSATICFLMEEERWERAES